METLKEIGRQLDRNIFPFVKNGGIVVPNTTSDLSLNLGEDNKNERQRKRRPTTQSWQRPAGRQRTPHQTASVVSAYLKDQCEKDLISVKEAYPNTQVWRQENGLWLRTESSLLPDYWRKAVFFTGISFRWPFIVRSWGFWVGGMQGSPIWIGPRHTNFPDGSICAFEPSDETWSFKDPIVALLDIYTLWAVRHLHLDFFGRWPGYQVAHHAYERILEIRGDEHCGCGSSELYEKCCQKKDLNRDLVADAVAFRFLNKERKPPDDVSKFICDQIEPPCISELLI